MSSDNTLSLSTYDKAYVGWSFVNRIFENISSTDILLIYDFKSNVLYVTDDRLLGELDKLGVDYEVFKAANSLKLIND